MLIRCPECHKEISDKAISCPHCGFPLSLNTQSIKENNDDTIIRYKPLVKRSIVGQEVFNVILIEICVGVMVGFSCLGSLIILIIAIVIGLLFEISIPFLIIRDVKNNNKLNALSDSEIIHDLSTNEVKFSDVDGEKHIIPLYDIIQFDGPSILKVTYYDTSLGRKRTSVLGYTTKDHVYKLRAMKRKRY